MSQDLIGYSKLTQNALRGVVKEALKMSINGLPGDHHFYISFKTQYKGVGLANYLVQKYPDEMTIVLQLQFDDLEVAFGLQPVTSRNQLHFRFLGSVEQRDLAGTEKAGQDCDRKTGIDFIGLLCHFLF